MFIGGIGISAEEGIEVGTAGKVEVEAGKG